MQSLQSALATRRLVCVSRCSLLLHALSDMFNALLSQQPGNRGDGDRVRLSADGSVRGAEGVKSPNYPLLWCQVGWTTGQLISIRNDLYSFVNTKLGLKNKFFLFFIYFFF